MMRGADSRVAVIGAGESGLAAALQASKLGATVTLIDERGISGAAIDSNAIVSLQASVWGLFPNWQIASVSLGTPHIVEAVTVILAPGAIETTMPFRGSTLPGVMTATGWQRLVSFGVVPGQRVAIVDAGGEVSHLKNAIQAIGCEVVAIVASGEASMTGRDQVETIQIADEALSIDIVVVAGVRVPDTMLAASAGCALEQEQDSGAWTVAANANGQTTVTGLWACGDIRGIGLNSEMAEIEAQLAATSACASLGLCDSAVIDSLYVSYQKLGASQARAEKDETTYRQPWTPPLLREQVTS